MSVTDNQVWMYIGTYAGKEEAGIHVAVMNQETGELHITSETAGVENPSYLALSADGRHLYAACEIDEGEIAAYTIDEQTHELHLIDRKATGGGAPCYVQLTPNGEHLLVANYSGKNANIFPVQEDGSLGEMSGEVHHEGSGTHPERQDAPHLHSAVSSLDSGMAYVSDLGLDQIVSYAIENGALVKAGVTELPPQSGPRHLVFHPNGQLAYGINELNSTVTSYARNIENGVLEILGTVSTLPDDFEGENTGGDIRLSLCGRHVYASNRGHDSLVHYHIDEQSGELTPVEWVPVKGKTPRNFAVVPGGYVLVCNQDSNNIAQFAAEPDTGRLTPTGHELTLNRPVCLMADLNEVEG